MSAWNRVTDVVVRHRRGALALSFLVTLACALAAPGIRFTSGVAGYLPEDVPAVRFWLELSRRFDAFSTLLVGLEEPGSPMTLEGVTHLLRVTRDLEELKGDGALAVRSITNVDSIREGEDGAIDTERLIQTVPSDPAGLAALRQRVLGDQEVLGALVSRDLMGYAILVRVDPRRDSSAVARLVEQVVERDRGPLEAYYFGAPFFSAVVYRHVYARLGWITAAFALLLLGVLAAGVRRPRVIALVLAGASLSLVWWLGAVRLCGLGLSQTSLNAALLLLAVAVVSFAGGAAARLQSDGPRGAAFPAAVAATLVALGLACLLLAQTTISYLAHFGVTMAVGVLAVGSFGLLAFLPAASFFAPRPSPPQPACRVHSPTAGVLAALAVILVGIWTAAHARFLVTPREMFSGHDEVGEALSFFDRRFGGTDFIQLSFKGDLRDPAVAARLLRLTDLLEGSRAFSDVRSVAQILAFLNHGFGGTYGIPNSRESLGNLWFFLEGSQDVRNLVSDRRDEAMVTLRVPAASPEAMRARIDTVRAAIAESSEVGPLAARRRLHALSAVAGLQASGGKLDALIARASRAPDAAERHALDAQVLPRLHRWLGSVDSPYRPSDQEWAVLAEALAGGKADVQEPVAAAAASLQGLPADQRDVFAGTVIARWKEMQLEARSERLAESLVGSRQGVADESLARLRGAVADLLAPQTSDGTAATVTVSGFPVVAGAIEADLERGLWTALLVLLGASALLLGVLTRQPIPTARRLLEAALATALTLIAARLLAVPIDSGSATIYLMPPLLGFLASTPFAGRSRAAFSLPTVFLLALAAAGLTLLFTGALPVTRIGATLSIGLTAAAIVSSLSSLTSR